MNRITSILFLFGLVMATQISAQTNIEGNKRFRVSGQVLDENTNEPIHFASISVVMNNEIVMACYSDEEGKFDMKVPEQLQNGGDCQLRVSYLNHVINDLKIVAKDNYTRIYLDAEVSLETVPIIWDIHITCCGPNWIFRRETAEFYRPFDEWMMMHSSEIQHSGRW